MNFVERCLYEFIPNINKIRSLRFILNNLMSVQAQGYDVHIYNSQNDPVSNVLILKERILNRINRISKLTLPVKKLDKSLCLSDNKQKIMHAILHKKFFQHKSIDDILRELAVSKSTLKRRNRELLNLAGKFLQEEKNS